MNHRLEKVASLLHREVAGLIASIELPAITTVSKVDVSPDLGHAKVWITVLSSDEETKEAVLGKLKANLYALQGVLNRDLKIRTVPRINFIFDSSEEYVAHINELIKKIKDLD